jgi:hypothetical protein
MFPAGSSDIPVSDRISIAVRDRSDAMVALIKVSRDIMQKLWPLAVGEGHIEMTLQVALDLDEPCPVNDVLPTGTDQTD